MNASPDGVLSAGGPQGSDKGLPFGGKRNTGSKPAHLRPPQLLIDLRHVYKRPEGEDRTQGQRALRELWVADKGAFMDRLQRAEREYRSGRGKGPAAAAEGGAGPGAVVAADAGEGRVLELIERLLADWEREKGS